MSNILKFFVKRVVILYIVLIVVCFLSKYQRIPMIIALTLGVFFSLLRFYLLDFVLRYLGASRNKNLAIIGVTIVLAVRIGIYTFIAALVGSLSIIIIVMINAITEALGITRNQYGQKVK
jgi:hypothetical protein